MSREVIILKEHHERDIKSSSLAILKKSPVPHLVVDKEAYVVYLNNEKIDFPKKEFELLLLLAANPGKVFKRTEILQRVWGPEYKQKDSRSLDVHIRMIRKKLHNLYVSTVRGVGYRMEK